LAPRVNLSTVMAPNCEASPYNFNLNRIRPKKYAFKGAIFGHNSR
jgi:hypothetical protein